jgi:hypothetical protein
MDRQAFLTGVANGRQKACLTRLWDTLDTELVEMARLWLYSPRPWSEVESHLFSELEAILHTRGGVP